MLNNNSSESSITLLAKCMINLLVKSFDDGGVNRPLVNWSMASTPGVLKF